MDSRNTMNTFLMILGIVFLPYGLYCFAVPGYLADAAGVSATTATGVVELRAMYGGLQAAFGVLLIAAARDSRFLLAGLAAVAFILPGLASARLLGVALGGDLSAYTIGALIFEIGSSVISLSLLRHQLSMTAHGAH
ncbi:MAG TPA: DUF4345 family protein [Candidatus Limnocylindrales bacterium]|nr:DUF4345 family protein [Candidatus Limnocylindrales bacterium]